MAKRLLIKKIRDLRASGKQDITLLGIYDVMGRWEVVVRMRVGLGFDRSGFKKDVEAVLVDAGVKRIVLDIIDQELENFTHSAKSVNETHREHACESTEDYVKNRCQKGFIRIKTSQDLELDGDQESVSDALSTVLSDGSRQILQAVCKSEDGGSIILELFMTCSQSSQVSVINQEIDPIIDKTRCPKSTLLCYKYCETFEDM